MIPDLVGPRELDRIRRQLAPHVDGAPFGRNDFEGLRSQRLYALLTKAPAVVDLVVHPEVLAVLDELLEPSYLLSANIAINVHPGETAQMLHADDAFCRVRRPRRALGVSAIWAIDDFTDTNGATEIVPGSHLFGDEVVAQDDARIRKIEMAAGSVVVFLGTTLLRGGALTGRTKRGWESRRSTAKGGSDRSRTWRSQRHRSSHRRFVAPVASPRLALRHLPSVHRLCRRPRASPISQRPQNLTSRSYPAFDVPVTGTERASTRVPEVPVGGTPNVG